MSLRSVMMALPLFLGSLSQGFPQQPQTAIYKILDNGFANLFCLVIVPPAGLDRMTFECGQHIESKSWPEKGAEPLDGSKVILGDGAREIEMRASSEANMDTWAEILKDFEITRIGPKSRLGQWQQGFIVYTARRKSTGQFWSSTVFPEYLKK